MALKIAGNMQQTGQESKFDCAFRNDLRRLFLWRRDVRRFQRDPVDHSLLDELLDLAQLSPSVGNSQPWRWVSVASAQTRALIQHSFDRCNAKALSGYNGQQAALYARLKLEGLDNSPVQYAVFADHATEQGHRLGQVTMPEALDYSVVSSIMTFWLAARAVGLGVGWVSILDAEEVACALHVPSQWRFIAYLCVGWPVEEHTDPELERCQWQARTTAGRTVLKR
jgi:5,6-dimethylbenzimidazole synthase